MEYKITTYSEQDTIELAQNIESEKFRNNFINYILSLYEHKNEKIKLILEKITSEFSLIKKNNNLLAIRSSSNLEDNSGQAGAGLFDSYLNIDLQFTNKKA